MVLSPLSIQMRHAWSTVTHVVDRLTIGSSILINDNVVVHLKITSQNILNDHVIISRIIQNNVFVLIVIKLSLGKRLSVLKLTFYLSLEHEE